MQAEFFAGFTSAAGGGIVRDIIPDWIAGRFHGLSQCGWVGIFADPMFLPQELKLRPSQSEIDFPRYIHYANTLRTAES